MKVILTGGGTGGPVAPLLAVAEEIRKQRLDTEFLFIGTKKGPEQKLVELSNIQFQSIPAAKWRRYFSLKNFTDIFKFMFGLSKAYRIVAAFKPDIVFSVGGFVAVPVAWAAKLKKVKIIIHQQDAEIGLANKLISPMANIITTAFEKTVKDIYSHSGLFKNEAKKHVEWVGNPVRKEFFDNSLPYKDFFKLHDQLPVLLIFGGGTGAKQINDVVSQCITELIKSHQVVHIMGTGKKQTTLIDPNYHVYDFLGPEMPTIMKMAHMVICRAGLSTISELSVLGKVAIVVPMPQSHQELNAAILKERSAAVVLDDQEFSAENLVRVVNSLKFNVERQKLLARNIQNLIPRDASQKLANIIINLSNANSK